MPIIAVTIRKILQEKWTRGQWVVMTRTKVAAKFSPESAYQNGQILEKKIESQKL